MNRNATLLARLLRPPLVLLKFVLDTAYAALFAWWLDSIEVKKANKEFLADVRRHLGFLFREYDARVLPNDREPPASFDWAMATISVKNIILTFFRDRGTVTVRISSNKDPQDSYELLAFLNAAGKDLTRQPFSHLLDVQPVLRRHMSTLEAAFSDNNFRPIKEQLSILSQQDEAVREQWEREINRRLYDRR